MAIPTKILVPTDFGAAGAAALAYACELARTVHATVCVLHVVDDPYPGGVDVERFHRGSAAIEQLEAAARHDLEELVHRRGMRQVGATYELRRGSPARQILARLQERSDIDLVVMGMRRRRGLSRLVCGSLVDDIVRRAPCPVVTVPAIRPRRPHAKEAA